MVGAATLFGVGVVIGNADLGRTTVEYMYEVNVVYVHFLGPFSYRFTI